MYKETTHSVISAEKCRSLGLVRAELSSGYGQCPGRPVPESSTYVPGNSHRVHFMLQGRHESPSTRKSNTGGEPCPKGDIPRPSGDGPVGTTPRRAWGTAYSKRFKWVNRGFSSSFSWLPRRCTHTPARNARTYVLPPQASLPFSSSSLLPVVGDRETPLHTPGRRPPSSFMMVRGHESGFHERRATRNVSRLASSAVGARKPDPEEGGVYLTPCRRPLPRWRPTACLSSSRGAVSTSETTVEIDAAIMDGRQGPQCRCSQGPENREVPHSASVDHHDGVDARHDGPERGGDVRGGARPGDGGRRLLSHFESPHQLRRWGPTFDGRSGDTSTPSGRCP